MSKKSKPFRICVEGATTDGRKIQREWLSQIAANYHPSTYGARINMEHYTRRRSVLDNPKRDRIENYESVNEAYVVEDYRGVALIENIEMLPAKNLTQPAVNTAEDA